MIAPHGRTKTKMKIKNALIITSAVMAASVSPASAGMINCSTMGVYTHCYTAPSFGESFAAGLSNGMAIRGHYEMLNAYREAHGLPRCHWGLIGALKSAADGRPMC